MNKIAYYTGYMEKEAKVKSTFKGLKRLIGLGGQTGAKASSNLKSLQRSTAGYMPHAVGQNKDVINISKWTREALSKARDADPNSLQNFRKMMKVNKTPAPKLRLILD